jgi:hypothetical protein
VSPASKLVGGDQLVRDDIVLEALGNCLLKQLTQILKKRDGIGKTLLCKSTQISAKRTKDCKYQADLSNLALICIVFQGGFSRWGRYAFAAE